MSQSMDGASLAKAVASAEGLHPPITVIGVIRKTSDEKVIELSLGGSRGWLKIPVDMIGQATPIEKWAGRDAQYDLVSLEFKWPDNAQAQVFATLMGLWESEEDATEFVDVYGGIPTLGGRPLREIRPKPFPNEKGWVEAEREMFRRYRELYGPLHRRPGRPK